MTRYCVQSKEFRITQEFLALMLGVRRVGVSAAMRSLRDRKLVTYRRGIITILDREGLAASACGCYKTVKDVYTQAQAQEGISWAARLSSMGGLPAVTPTPHSRHIRMKVKRPIRRSASIAR